jgi:hypothetical protein
MPAFDKGADMRFSIMLVLAGIGLGGGAFTHAGGQAVQAGQNGWTEAQSLRELPAGIQALLGVGLGVDGIADRNERFNESDVLADNMPRRRFALGVVDGDAAMVAIEQGGRAYAVRAVEFRQAGATWDAVRCAWMSALPRHGTDLVEALSGKGAGTCRGAGIRTAEPDAEPAPPMRVRPRPGA